MDVLEFDARTHLGKCDQTLVRPHSFDSLHSFYFSDSSHKKSPEKGHSRLGKLKTDVIKVSYTLHCFN